MAKQKAKLWHLKLWTLTKERGSQIYIIICVCVFVKMALKLNAIKATGELVGNESEREKLR
jgi:hypothetical protein